jgi:hypothetical protein
MRWVIVADAMEGVGSTPAGLDGPGLAGRCQLFGPIAFPVIPNYRELRSIRADVFTGERVASNRAPQDPMCVVGGHDFLQVGMLPAPCYRGGKGAGCFGKLADLAESGLPGGLVDQVVEPGSVDFTERLFDRNSQDSGEPGIVDLCVMPDDHVCQAFTKIEDLVLEQVFRSVCLHFDTQR